MKILITGAAGFIGSHLCKKYLELGHEVVGIDNMQSGHIENLPDYHQNFTFAKVDIRDKEIEQFIEWADIVSHQAANKKANGHKDQKIDLDINGWGTLHLVNLSIKHNVKKFIHASTGSVYGEANGTTHENTLLKPCSYYGVSKLAGEQYVRMSKLNYTIFRYFHVYGENQESRDKIGGVVSIFARRARKGKPLIIYGDGNQVRSFTHVDDIVKANVLALEKGDRQIYNCASGIRVSIRELAEEISDYYGISPKVEYRDWIEGDIVDFNIDNSKIELDFDITFKRNLDFSWLK